MLARFFLIAAAACFIIAPAASADVIDGEGAVVFVLITPTIDVMYNGGEVQMDTSQANDQICALLTFTVHANDQVIQMMGGGSRLFKDDNPMSPYAIPVDSTEEVVLTVDDPGVYFETHSALPSLVLVADAGPYGMIDIFHTPWMGFGSGLNGTWSFDVTLYMCWLGSDAELPVGRYSGFVFLWATFPVI